MRLASSLTTLVLAFVCAAAAFGQSAPGVDHYLVYKVLNPPTFTVPVILSDQLIQGANYQTYTLEYFMTPVNKNNEGILDPVTHYTWWRINPYPYGAHAIISNQFWAAGVPVDIFEPQFLLNPALKSIPPNPPPTGPVPFKDHYVNYRAAGPPPGVIVNLLDQFGPLQAYVDSMVYLAPPAQKIYQGQVFPILDPVDHLAFYRITPPAGVVPPPPVSVLDEFGLWQLALGPPVMLGVPSIKTGVVGTKQDSWGQLKALYR